MFDDWKKQVRDKLFSSNQKVVLAKGRQMGKSHSMAAVTAMAMSWGVDMAPSQKVVSDPNDQRPQEVKDLLKKMGYKPTWERFENVPPDPGYIVTASVINYQPATPSITTIRTSGSITGVFDVKSGKMLKAGSG